MRKWLAFTVSAVLLLTGCTGLDMSGVPLSSPYATVRRVSAPVQCVPYAREVSGIRIRGDAYSWWDSAAPDYQRGRMPKPGAVLVLARTAKMRHGHLAVVKDVISPRQINVAHSNWGNDKASRRLIYDSMRVEDVSARNDWSQVRFWNIEENVFGFPYAARGFVYP